MKRREKEEYFMNFLASNGGKLKQNKMITQLVNAGVIKTAGDYQALQDKLVKNGCIEFKDNVIELKERYKATPSLEDIYMNDNRKVKDDVMLSPNAMNGSPTHLPM